MDNTKSVKRKLFDKLKTFYNDKDFVVGVISYVTEDEDRQTVIDYIDNGKDVSVENVILLSLYLNNQRKNIK